MKSIVTMIVAALALLVANVASESADLVPLVLDLKPGDLVFRDGVGYEAGIVRLAGSQRWTHVGVVVEREGRLLVLHADPDRGVVLDTEERYWRESTGGAKLAIPHGEEVAREAVKYFGRLFDRAFDLDNSDAIYCTELIYLAMRDKGVWPGIERRQVGMFLSVLLPEDLYRAFQPIN